MDLRTARKNAGISQVELAKALGCERTTITCIETGRSLPSVKLAQKIAKILDFDWWELYPDFTKGSE